MFHRIEIIGAGGGKGAAQGQGAVEAPNTLQSQAQAKFVDLLSEGEIEGLVDGDKSVFFNKVPTVNPDGSKNYEGFGYKLLKGTPDQVSMEGFDEVASEFGVGQRVRFDTPVEYLTNGDQLDAVVVTLMIPALTKADKKTGNVDGYQVQIAIDIRNESVAGSQWVTKVASDWISGKNTAPYERSYRIALNAPGRYVIRMRRLSEDSTGLEITDQTHFQRVTEVIERKLNYADSAVMGVEISAEQFSGNIPDRAYEVYGMKVKYPKGYDPIARTYPGFWDGTWSYGYTNNPAWVFYAMATHPRYGVGIEEALMDKWGLYQIAQYCDQMVPDGQGGMEPRFQFNGFIGTREEAYKVLQAIASMMRAIIFYSAGSVIIRQDRPHETIAGTFTKANIVGDFNYSSTAKKARHTLANVQWINPKLGYEQDYVAYEDRIAMMKYGYNPIQVAAYGTTNRGQAYRLGKWAVTTDLVQTESCNFRGGWDAAGLMPGDVIEVADNHWATADFGGRVMDKNDLGNVIKLDREINMSGATSPELHLTLVKGPLDDVPGVDNSGRPLRRQMTHFSSNIIGWNAATLEVTLATPIPADRLPDETPVVWVFSKEQVKPRMFKVISIAEADGDDKGQYDVVCINYVPGKFAAVDSPFNVEIGDDHYSDLPGVTQVEPPTEPFDIKAESVYKNGLLYIGLSLSWGASKDYYLRGYLVQYRKSNGNWITMPLSYINSMTIEDLQSGVYYFNVRAVNRFGLLSIPLELTVQIGSTGATGKGLVYDIRTTEGGQEFTGQDAHLVWSSNPIVYDIWGVRASVLVNGGNSAVATWDTKTTPQNPRLTFIAGLVVNDHIEVRLDDDTFNLTVTNPDPNVVAQQMHGLIAANANYSASAVVDNVITLIPSFGVDNELETSATSDPLFFRFVIRIYDYETETLLRTTYSKEEKWTYDYPTNLQDGLTVSARRTFWVGITVEDVNNQECVEERVAIYNVAPSLETIKLEWNATTVTIRYNQPLDPDFRGILVWLSQTTGFTPAPANLIYRGMGNPVFLVESLQTYYMRYAFFDAFGETGLHYSVEYKIEVPVSSLPEDLQDAIDFILSLDDETIAAIGHMDDIVRATNWNAQAIMANMVRNEEYVKRYEELMHLPDGQTVGAVVIDEQAKVIKDKEVWVNNFKALGAITPDGNAWILNGQTVWVTPTQSFAAYDFAITGQFNTTKGLITTSQEISLGATEAVAKELHLLGVQNGNKSAFIINENTTYIGPNESMATRFEGVTSDIGDAKSAAVSESQTYVDRDSAFAKTLSGLSVTQGQFQGVITNAMNVDTKYGAKWGLSLDVNGKVGGMAMMNNGQVTNMVFAIDRFMIANASGTVMPFYVDTAQNKVFLRDTHVQGALVVDGSIVADKIRGGAVSTMGTLESGTLIYFPANSQQTHDHLHYSYPNEGGDILVNTYCEIGSPTSGANGVLIEIWCVDNQNSQWSLLMTGAIYCPGSWGNTGLSIPCKNRPPYTGYGVTYVVRYKQLPGSGQTRINRTFMVVTELKK